MDVQALLNLCVCICYSGSFPLMQLIFIVGQTVKKITFVLNLIVVSGDISKKEGPPSPQTHTHISFQGISNEYPQQHMMFW